MFAVKSICVVDKLASSRVFMAFDVPDGRGDAGERRACICECSTMVDTRHGHLAPARVRGSEEVATGDEEAGGIVVASNALPV